MWRVITLQESLLHVDVDHYILLEICLISNKKMELPISLTRLTSPDYSLINPAVYCMRKRN